MAAKKSTNKPAKKRGLRPQKGGKGPTMGPPPCGERHGVDEPGCKFTNESGHVEDGRPYHRNKKNGHKWL
jgi:hypothetical protein